MYDIIFACPKCNQSLKAKPSMSGKVYCPACNAELTIPAAEKQIEDLGLPDSEQLQGFEKQHPPTLRNNPQPSEAKVQAWTVGFTPSSMHKNTVRLISPDGVIHDLPEADVHARSYIRVFGGKMAQELIAVLSENPTKVIRLQPPDIGGPEFEALCSRTRRLNLGRVAAYGAAWFFMICILTLLVLALVPVMDGNSFESSSDKTIWLICVTALAATTLLVWISLTVFRRVTIRLAVWNDKIDAYDIEARIGMALGLAMKSAPVGVVLGIISDIYGFVHLGSQINNNLMVGVFILGAVLNIVVMVAITSALAYTFGVIIAMFPTILSGRYYSSISGRKNPIINVFELAGLILVFPGIASMACMLVVLLFIDKNAAQTLLLGNKCVGE